MNFTEKQLILKRMEELPHFTGILILLRKEGG